MAQPRYVRPGRTLMITRRCYQRTFRLRPSDPMNQLFLYCLALAVRKSGVVFHGGCVMSNHHHVTVTDVEGRFPIFARELHRTVAKCVNAMQGESENLWSAHRAHVTELGDEDDIIENLAYIAANPVDEGLVATPKEWPGLMLLPRNEAYPLRVRRPEVYFGKDSTAPEELELIVTPPPDVERFVERLESAIARQVEQAHEKAQAEGRPFLGRAAAESTSFLARARSQEPRGQRVPKVTARRPEVRKRLVRERRDFEESYHDAMRRWRAGDRDVAFPEGTWWMRRVHGVAPWGPDAVAA